MIYFSTNKAKITKKNKVSKSYLNEMLNVAKFKDNNNYAQKRLIGSEYERKNFKITVRMPTEAFQK